MKNNKLAGTWFCGNEASDYAKEKGYLDYATLAKAFDAALNNNIMQLTSEIGYWDQTNGMIDNSDEIEEYTGTKFSVLMDFVFDMLTDDSDNLKIKNEGCNLDKIGYRIIQYIVK